VELRLERTAVLDIDPDVLATDLRASHPRQADRRTAHARPGGAAAVVRVRALLHVVPVTIGAMDSSWAMAKSLGMSQSQITKEEIL
jgi:acetyl-CoA carboxylase beta subunit